jgi:lipopolysaccharide assembly outer membrane protein LptD (OstA)
LRAFYTKITILLIVLYKSTAAVEIQTKDYIIKGQQFTIEKNKIFANSDFTIQAENFDFQCQANSGSIEDSLLNLDQANINWHRTKILAEKIQIKKDQYYSGEKITATFCKECDKKNKPPLWQIRADKFYTNLLQEEEIQFKDVYIDILGREIFKLPTLKVPSFWTKGRSGFLLPKVKYGMASGFEITTPFYFIISKNLDLVFAPKISRKPIYDLEIRNKFSTGGYQISILTGKPHLENLTNDKLWPSLIKGSGNFFSTYHYHCSNFNRGHQLGFRGEIALGDKAVFLQDDQFNPYQAMIGEAYYSKITDQSLLEVKFLQIEDKNNRHKQLVIPQIDFTYLKPLVNKKTTLIQTITTNNFYDLEFNLPKLNLLIENKLLIKDIISGHHLIYQPKVITFLDNNKKILDPRLTIEWSYNKLDYVIPQASLNLASHGSYLSKNLDEEQIYTINNPFNANSKWSLFTKNLKSLHLKSKAYFDYGITLYNSNLNSLSLIKRDYFDPNYKNYYLQTKSDSYALQFNIDEKNLLIRNKSWFTNDLKLSNNELYFRKAFSRFQAGFNYFFFDKEINLLNQKMENHLMKTKLQYKITDNITFTFKNSFLFNDENRINLINYKYNKFELKFQNDCAEIALAIKQFLTKKKEEQPEALYQIYFKIPQIT